MTDHILPALIVFGVLLAIAIIGLVRSNAASARLHGSTHDAGHPADRRMSAAPSDPLRR